MFNLLRLFIISVLTLMLNGCLNSSGIEQDSISIKLTSTSHHTLVESSGAAVDVPVYTSAYLGDIAPEPFFNNFCPAFDSLTRVPNPDNLWDKLRGQFVLDHHAENALVQAELKWLLKHPKYMERVVRRAKPYLYYIANEISVRNLPAELALLPIVESAYDPFAYSPSRASGLWQFIPSTARMFEIDMDWWIDDRRNVKVSTLAALEYLKRLNRSFKGDWLLALASYNAGARNIRKAIRNNRNAGEPVDFWSLKLFRETTNYVPRLLALSLLIANPDRYDFSLESIANKPYWVEVETGGQLDLAKAAELADVSIEEMYLLNPSFNQWSTHPNGPNKLLVPANKEVVFSERLKSLQPGDRLKWVLHKVKQGESLNLIARRNGTTIESIKKVNRLNSNIIRVGKSLMIPAPSLASNAYALSKETRLQGYQNTIQNRKNRASEEYLVQQSDTFWSLAQKFDVAPGELAKWNGMATSDPLQTGKKLKIWANPDIGALPQKPQVIRKVNYKVRKGDSLSHIANKFNLSVGHIQKWNNEINRAKYIKPGEKLTLFVDVTQTE